MSALFSGSTMCWTGSNLLHASDRQRAAFLAELAGELSEIARSHGAVGAMRLDKLVQAPRRGFGPDYLAVMEFDGAAPEMCRAPARANESWAPAYEPMWQMRWRRLFDSGAAPRPARIRLLALSPPADASAAELAEWNRFYNEVHVPEAMQRRGWTRATRWRLEHCDLHPNPGCPSHFVAYEASGFTDATEAEVAAKGPWTEGPPVWKRHSGSWTLDYLVPPAADR